MTDDLARTKVYDEAIVIDGLGPVFWYQDDKEKYLEVVHKSGLTAFNHTMVLPYDYQPDGFMEFVDASEEWRQLSRKRNKLLVIACTSKDIVRAKAERKVAVIFSLQNPFPMGARLHYLAALHRLGLRVCQLSYQRRSLLADGCGEPADAGLSSLGKAAIEEMNHLHIVIDLSHCGRRASVEAVGLSKHPVIISHTGADAMTSSSRNITDEQIDAVAGRGGVIGVMAEKEFIARPGRSLIDSFLDHLDYLLERAGADHVGIGLDTAEGFPESRLQLFQRMLPETGMQETDYMIPELNSPTKLKLLVGRMMARGHAEGTIQKVLGLNFLRVFQEVWDSRESA